MSRALPLLITLLLLSVGIRSAQAEELLTTPEHWIWVTNRDSQGDGRLGGWVEAKSLKPGDRFQLADGSEAILRATETTHHEVEPDVLDPNVQRSTFNLQPM